MRHEIKPPVTRGVRQLSHPHWSPDGCYLVFTESGQSYHGLSIAKFDGSEYRRLIDHGAQQGIWSPDGSKIAHWNYWDTEHPPGLFVINADGTNLVPLVQADAVFNIAWSPDSQALIFDTFDDVWLVDLCQGTTQQLPRTSEKASRGYWSASSKYVGYTDRGIWIYDRARQTRSQFLRYGVIEAWSPQGDIIYGVSEMRFRHPDGSITPPEDVESGLFVHTAKGKTLKLGSNNLLTNAQYARNGEKLLFRGRRLHTVGYFLARNNLKTITKLDDGEEQMLHVTLSPDGRQIAFTKGDGSLHIKRVA